MSLIEVRKNWNSIPRQVELTSVDVKGNIFEHFGDITITQRYLNNFDDNLETYYYFPLTTKDVITDLKININDERKLVGILKEKETAKKEYNQAVSENKTAVLLEKHAHEIYRVQIGNLPAHKFVEIQISYLTHLKINANKVTFVLPTSIAPKYQLNNNSLYGMSCFNYSETPHKNYTFKINLNITSQTKILSVDSYTHNEKLALEPGKSLTYTDNNASVELETSPLEGDFNLIAETENIFYPKAYSYQDEKTTYFMLIHKLDDQDAKVNNSEYIFMIDRSGSMEGEKIRDAKNALEFSIRSLPKDSSFNIVSFGSEFKLLWTKSKYYDNDSMLEAINEVETFQANMEGTEILKPLAAYIDGDQAPIEGAARRNIILISDGEVSDTKSIIQKIRSKRPNDRLFTIGVGRSASRSLLEGIADIGNGICEMIIDSANLQNSLINLLDLSNKEFYYNISVSVKSSSLSTTDQDYTFNQNYAFPNIPFVTFVKIPTEDCKKIFQDGTFRFMAKDSQDRAVEMNVPIVELQNVSLIKPFYAVAKIKQFADVEHPKIKEMIVKLSLDYHIVSQEVSFIIVDSVILQGNIEDSQVNSRQLSGQKEGLVIQGSISHREIAGLESLVELSASLDDLTFTNCSAVVESQSSSGIFSGFLSKAKKFIGGLGSSNNVPINSRNVVVSSAISTNSKTKGSNNSKGTRDFSSLSNHSAMNELAKKTIAKQNSKDEKTEKKTIFEYQNADGTFLMNSEVYNLIGLTKAQMDELELLSEKDRFKRLQLFILEFLKDKNDSSLRLIIKKLENFLKSC